MSVTKGLLYFLCHLFGFFSHPLDIVSGIVCISVFPPTLCMLVGPLGCEGYIQSLQLRCHSHFCLYSSLCSSSTLSLSEHVGSVRSGFLISNFLSAFQFLIFLRDFLNYIFYVPFVIQAS